MEEIFQFSSGDSQKNVVADSIGGQLPRTETEDEETKRRWWRSVWTGKWSLKITVKVQPLDWSRQGRRLAKISQLKPPSRSPSSFLVATLEGSLGRL